MDHYEHGGNIQKINREYPRPKNGWIDFSANINPLGVPDEIKYFIQNHIDDIDAYPDPESGVLVQAACRRYGVEPGNIIAANGASEIFFNLLRILPSSRVILPVPSYSDYERSIRLEKKKIVYHDLRKEENFELKLDSLSKRFRGREIVIIGRPNNPTGNISPYGELLELIKKHPKTFFIIDEAFIDFVEPGEGETSLASTILPNLITVLSLTKMYAIAGLRAGLAIGPEAVIQKAKSLQSSWPLNFFAQHAGALALEDRNWAENTRKFIKQERNYLLHELGKIRELQVFPGSANFLLLKINDILKSDELYHFALDAGIILRRCGNFTWLNDTFFRIAILSHDDNEKLVAMFLGFFNNNTVNSEKINSDLISRAPARAKRKTPAIMIQGTGSNVGKSLLATAFCRIFLNEGYHVTPFKAQNMSLNSCVTMDGHEISRAQHLQSLAAKVEPDVKMNPVLIKPVEKSLSQIILMGKPLDRNGGNQSYEDYRRNKEKIWEYIRQAYDELSSTADLMIIEGAGSPVEMNLKSHDIVNMKMAEYAGAKVLLAGNIDYGGIFASFVGTLILLTRKEKERVIGLLVNQFRGDESLFTEGKKMLERITGKPLLGTIPYVDKLMLPDEDSLAFARRHRNPLLISEKDNPARNIRTINIAIIQYPHISNFTDFDPFYPQDEITISFLQSPVNDTPDVIILPGSKNVIADMQWLNDTGLANYIARIRDRGKTEIVGLCGGLQMLGSLLRDPHGIESGAASGPKEIRGLGLLEITTELETDKILKKFSGRHSPSNCEIQGYEIHHGITNSTGTGSLPQRIFADHPDAGFSSQDGIVWGTYIHGAFDNDEFRKWFINRALGRKKLPPFESIITYNVDAAIENFARVVKERIDLDAIRKAVGLH